MRKVLYYLCACLILAVSAQNAHSKEVKPKSLQKSQASTATPAVIPVDPAKPDIGASDPQVDGPVGTLDISVFAEVTRTPLAAKVELHRPQGRPFVIEVPKGKTVTQQPVGTHEALTYVYQEGVPILIDVREVVISSQKPSALSVGLLEGTTGGRRLDEFDRDFDLALDRVELAAKTDPNDATSVPGRKKITVISPVLAKKKQWYRGELHAQSKHGIGSESVRELVARAEAAGLDFLAIADPNTLAAAQDPEFKSGSVVLIPAMLWGNDQKGYALIYGPQTFPEPATTDLQAQAVCRLVQAQGGVFAAAHPCLPGRIWQWEVPYVNAVEVWCRGWGDVPPASLALLQENMKRRTRKLELITSIAAAVDTKRLTGNGQACLFWDYELARNHKSTPIAGSMTGSPAVPMGTPLTYVYAEEKSVRGILDGIRNGRTYVTQGMDGPQLEFSADALRDGKIDVSVGGAVPVGTNCDFYIGVRKAQGKKVEVLRNGLPICSKVIETDDFGMKIPQNLDTPAAFRVRVIDSNLDAGNEPVKTLALSGPIYSDGIILLPKGMRPEDVRLKVQDKSTLKSGLVAPVYATGVKKDEDGNEIVQIEKGPAAAPPPVNPGSLPPFNAPGATEIKPREVRESR